jgi:hypothetical protein
MESEIRRLVESQLGVSVRSIAPLRAGLGLRRFFRVATSGTPATLVARVEAPEDDAGRPMGAAPEPPLEPLRGFLEAAGLPVPARLGGDDAAGITLLEDVGDTTLEDAVAAASIARCCATRASCSRAGACPRRSGAPRGKPRRAQCRKRSRRSRTSSPTRRCGWRTATCRATTSTCAPLQQARRRGSR